MSVSSTHFALEHFTTFGDLLKYLRRRAGYTQRELSIAVGYSDTQISRLEHNERLPDLATLTARFLPASCPSSTWKTNRRSRRGFWNWLPPCAGKTHPLPVFRPTKGSITSMKATPNYSLAAMRYRHG